MNQKKSQTYTPPNLVAGLDIGTTKVCMVVALIEGNELEIIGSAMTPSVGLKKGNIVNRDATVAAIKKVVEDCYKKCGYRVDSVCVGIAGDHIEGINSHGVVSIKNEVIDNSDIYRVIDSAKPACPEEKKPIHILSQEYTVDYQSGFNDPQGISGKRLEANVHVVLAATSALANITRSCVAAGLHVERIVLEPYASALAVLNEDEKELGVLLLDIGGGTTDMLVYKNQSIQMSKIIPLGGNNVTYDISVGLITPRNYAEEIKCKEGFILTPDIDQNEIIEITSIADHPTKHVSRKALTDIIEPRYMEIFETAQRHLQIEGITFPSGVVLTGGGSSIKGLNHLAARIFGTHTRTGYPHDKVQGAEDFVKYPSYATAVGLLRYVIQSEKADFSEENSVKNKVTSPVQEKGFFEFIKKFF